MTVEHCQVLSRVGEPAGAEGRWRWGLMALVLSCRRSGVDAVLKTPQAGGEADFPAAQQLVLFLAANMAVVVLLSECHWSGSALAQHGLLTHFLLQCPPAPVNSSILHFLQERILYCFQAMLSLK